MKPGWTRFPQLRKCAQTRRNLFYVIPSPSIPAPLFPHHLLVPFPNRKIPFHRVKDKVPATISWRPSVSLSFTLVVLQCPRFTLQLLVNRESRATTRYTRFLFLPALIFSPPLRGKKWRWFSKRTVPRNPSHALLAISAGLIISNLVRFNTGEKIEELE